MPAKLSTTISKISSVPNPTNSAIIREFSEYMKWNGSSEHHQNNNLKAVLAFAKFIGPHSTFYQMQTKEQIIAFLDTKKKIEDNEKKWITTWNHYLVRIKLFFRWLYNVWGKDPDNIALESDWETPSFAGIKRKKSKRISPYSETELWERDELFSIIKYEPYKRNKAALTLFWDLDARNHEVTLLKIKNIRLKEKYGEGEIPYESKTGTGPILLTCSFPYVRDWLNEHPFKNSPNARVICNLITGSPIGPDAMWTMMKQLRNRIVHLLKSGSITNNEERRKLEYLLQTKKWNPYCIRHSSITSDSDYLSDYALKKKARWSMNSKQPSRYIKSRMGNELKNQILVHDGIITEESAVAERKPSALSCARCSLVNALDNKFCSKCSYPLTPQAFEQIKAEEEERFKAIDQKYGTQIALLTDQVRDMQQLLKNPEKLAEIYRSAKLQV